MGGLQFTGLRILFTAEKFVGTCVVSIEDLSRNKWRCLYTGALIVLCIFEIYYSLLRAVTTESYFQEALFNRALRSVVIGHTLLTGLNQPVRKITAALNLEAIERQLDSAHPNLMKYSWVTTALFIGAFLFIGHVVILFGVAVDKFTSQLAFKIALYDVFLIGYFLSFKCCQLYGSMFMMARSLLVQTRLKKEVEALEDAFDNISLVLEDLQNPFPRRIAWIENSETKQRKLQLLTILQSLLNRSVQDLLSNYCVFHNWVVLMIAFFVPVYIITGVNRDFGHTVGHSATMIPYVFFIIAIILIQTSHHQVRDSMKKTLSRLLQTSSDAGVRRNIKRLLATVHHSPEVSNSHFFDIEPSLLLDLLDFTLLTVCAMLSQ